MALNQSAIGTGNGGGGAHAQPSLPSLPSHLQSGTHLTAHLASRFHASLPTARLSSHGLITLNTYTSSTKGYEGTREGSAAQGAEDIAERAFIRLGHRSENQAVLFLGESGSGKTTVRSHLLKALLAKSSTPLSTKLAHAVTVFDALTTTKTATTPVASKAGLFYELQYDSASSSHPTLIGGKLLDHRLERSRITDVPTGERNFHVLYYLMAGTSGVEKDHLGLVGSHSGERTRWRYLGHPTQLKVGINDAECFASFKGALRQLEFPRSEIAEMCQILAAILHIGQFEFEMSEDTMVEANESGGYSHEGGTIVANVRNKETLSTVAAFLGVSTQDLQQILRYKTRMIHKERVTVMLDAVGAREHADELARTLYSLLVAYVIEAINQRICAPEDSVANTISIVDFPGFAQQSSTLSTLDQLLNNAAAESIYNRALQEFFHRRADLIEAEEVIVDPASYFDNSDAVRALLKPNNGMLAILDDQTRRNRTDMQLLEAFRKRFEGKNPAVVVGAAQAKLPGSNFLSENKAATFMVRHFAGEVEYPIQGLIEENSEVISGDLVSLVSGSKSDFVARLFGQDALHTVRHPAERTAIMQASVSSKPARTPSVISRRGYRPKNRRRPSSSMRLSEIGGVSSSLSGAGDDGKDDGEQGAAGQVLAALDNVTQALSAVDCNSYFVFCLKPNDRRIANQFDSKCVRAQLQTFGITEISQRLRSADFSVFLPFAEFLGLTSEADDAGAGASLMDGERERVQLAVEERRWPSNEVQVGATGVFLSERRWLEITNLGGSVSAGSAIGGRYGLDSEFSDAMPMNDPYASREGLLANASTPLVSEKNRSGEFYAGDDARSDAGASAFGGGDMFKNLETREEMEEKSREKDLVEVEEYKDSPSRKRWVAVTWMLTFWIPEFLIRWLGKMPRKDVRMAWREKVAINMLIWLLCLIAAFVIVGFPMVICPRQHVYSANELSAYDGSKGSPGMYAAIRGEVFDLEGFIPTHYPNYINAKYFKAYAGLDITSLFPVQVSALCPGRDDRGVDPHVTLDWKSQNLTGSSSTISPTDAYRRYHDFRYFTNDSRPDWFTEQMMILRSNYRKGRIGLSQKYVSETMVPRQSRVIGTINKRLYDLTEYLQGGLQWRGKPGESPPDGATTQDATKFMDDSVVSLFQQRAGSDLTQLWEQLAIDRDVKRRMMTCLDNLFYIGDVDTRNSVRCKFSEYFVLAISMILTSILGFKFFAALQFGSKPMPENLDKFIMCMIPAYTEDEESLRRAIDSAARMRYDDKRKLLVVVCDGMIIGQGNDRPTPRIVLDILGVSEMVDPEALSFEALGEGLKQHNMGKIYSGLYEVQGHIVPFLVVVKVGKPSEVQRPGNRGKRDSQMVIMRFLNRVHYNLPMSPMELEMYHQIRNIIGVNPTFYEFMLQIDADTVVAADSATRMVSAFLDDTRLIAVCGETALTNAKASFITMIQVYEYYISHNLSKAFESLFGSVTCLPGCFSMYRIRAADTGKPLFVSREIVDAYSTIRVDTLHMKNLLHLGEDRYLTTLLLKHHSRYKTKYIFEAHAWTIAPDSWKVFLSQRRRWINSTVHNLMALIPLNQLCGFCCFSMRFIVLVDLLSTIVQPVTVAYIAYLIVLVVRNSSVVPVTAFILLGAIYGLQAIIFILRRKWEMVGWMILYIVAIPVFSFGLPLYAFWHMDDFNWGNTRVVAGDNGKKVVITDEGKFDPASIPRKKWEDYQTELWDAQTTKDDARSEISGFSYNTKAHLQMMGGGGAAGAGPYGPYGHHHPSAVYSGGVAGAPAMSEYGGGIGGGTRMAGSRPGSVFGGVGAQPGFSASNLNVNRMSQFGGSQFFSTVPPPAGGDTELEMSNLSGAGGGAASSLSSGVGAAGVQMPSDDALLAETRDILRTADLMTVTRKGVKQELERRFGVPLDSRRAYINSVTEALLSGQI